MEIKQTSNSYGFTQEAEVISILGQYGTVSVPFGNSARYDCILDLNDENILYRIQIKSLNILEDGNRISIPMQTQHCKTGVKHPYTTADTDFIAIAFEHQCYLFKPDMAKQSLIVTINYPEYENQHWLYDYEATKVLGITFTSWVEIKQQQRVIQQQTQAPRCAQCGKVISKGTKLHLCAECYGRYVQSLLPTKEELSEKLKTMNIPQISNYYSVTDTTVRKWCKKYNLPHKAASLKIWRQQ